MKPFRVRFASLMKELVACGLVAAVASGATSARGELPMEPPGASAVAPSQSDIQQASLEAWAAEHQMKTGLPPGCSKDCVHRDTRCEDDLCRAGRPDLIAHWAHCSYNRRYRGYYVGGGAHLYGRRASHCHGESRCPDEGTFGIDYDPWWSRVRLQWFHGKRFQGGEGQYAPDGCNNPFANFFDK